MVFKGVTRDFILTDEAQYDTIGNFWNEMAQVYGLENLQGLGYKWRDNILSYAIGLKNGDISGYNLSIKLPDNGWETVEGYTSNLKLIYDRIYKNGPLAFEIETFFNDGKCSVKYFRRRKL
ncbi:MAG TPA: hypothetical protein PKC96_06915 [Bacilli bacterium]|nr:hypothetical protein [Bacilli bacterium]